MKSKLAALAAALLLLGCGTDPATATGNQERILPYSEQALSQATSRGGTVVIETHADWCAPCRIQAPIVAKLLREQRYRDVTIVRVGEETPKAVWKKFALVGYGTMVVYRGGKEVARGQPMTETAMRELFSARR